MNLWGTATMRPASEGASSPMTRPPPGGIFATIITISAGDHAQNGTVPAAVFDEIIKRAAWPERPAL